MSCLFCDNIQNIIYQTENFYIKIGKGIITAGHVMIIPKKHCPTIASIDKLILKEYLDLKEKVIDKVTKEFAKPFSIEYGVFGQSVFHGHLHVIPSSGNGYKNINIIDEMVLPTIKKYNLNYKIINGFNEVMEIFKEDKEYLYFEFNDEKYVLRIKGFKEEDFEKEDISYRYFFKNKKHLVGIDSWKTMTEDDIILDNKKIEETKNKILIT